MPKPSRAAAPAAEADAAAPAEPDALTDEPTLDDDETPEEILDKPKLSPDDLVRLHALYEEVATRDDEDAKILKRRIESRIRRVTHAERHPGEKIVEVNVPRAADGTEFQINGKAYSGLVRVPECVARELLAMAHRNAVVDAERMRDNGRAEVHLGIAGGAGFLAERARRIAAA
jgi:hypothetical protein